MKNNSLMQYTNTVIPNIIKAAMENKTVIISYRDVKGIISSRETEPYEIKNGSYFGYCLEKQSIRQFKLDSVLAATQTETTYTPRWAVKIS